MRYAAPLLLGSMLGVGVLGCALSHERPPPGPSLHSDAGIDAGRAPDARVEDADIAPDAPSCSPIAELCDGLDQDRDGHVDEDADADCPLDHGVGACLDGACRVRACDEGFADCDGDPSTGCEAAVTIDRNACGACGSVCRVSEACVAGRCEREEIIDLAAGYHSALACVVLASGRLVCWGRNEWGVVRPGTMEDQLVPIEVEGVDRVRRCAVSGVVICVLTEDDRVLCRGPSVAGIATEWREIEGLADLVELHAGLHNHCALDRRGVVSCWGQHLPSGDLGLGPEGPAATWTPATPLGLPPAVRAIGLGERNGCAVDAGGITRCWGRLFMRTTGLPIYELEPFEVPQERGAVWLSQAAHHGCFIDGDGWVRCWGADAIGGLGVGSTEYHADPVVHSSLGPADAVFVNSTLTAVLTRDRRVFWWGVDITLPLDAMRIRSTPQHVPELDGAARIALNDLSICAQLGPYSVRCMGVNEHGILGDGTYDNRSYPAPVVGFE